MAEPESISIVVNGAAFVAPAGTTVRGLVELHRLSVEKVAVELNRRLVRSAGYDTVLKAGDVVEIVTFVGGG